jgi:hypothetical protein
VRLNKHARLQVLIYFPVRSHPVLVLPSTGGRYSLGFVVSFRGHHQLKPSPRDILSCTLSTYASESTLYFRVLRINQPELPPKRRFIPYRLCTLLLPQDLSAIHNLAYGFTSCTGVPFSPLHAIFNCIHADQSTLWWKCRVLPVHYKLSHPKVGHSGWPKTEIPLQSIEKNSSYLIPVTRYMMQPL